MFLQLCIFKETELSNVKDKMNYKMPIGHKQTKAIALNEKFCEKEKVFCIKFSNETKSKKTPS